MAWNDPPSFDYQQMSNTGRKFKHRYVLSDTNSKLGQSSPQFQQAPFMANNNQYQQRPMAPIQQGHPHQPYSMDQSQPTQPQPTYSSDNKIDNGMISSTPNMAPLGSNGVYQGFNGSPYGGTSNDASHNNLNNNNQTTMYQDPQQQFQSAPPPPQQMLFQQQQQSFQPQ